MTVARQSGMWQAILFGLVVTIQGGRPACGEEPRAELEQVPLSQQLVRSALKFELAGDNDYRQLVLKAALKEDPYYKPARWQLGMVQVDDHWVGADELPSISGSESLLDEYRVRRARAMGQAASELGLARWCQQRGLVDQAHAHFTRVQRGLVPATEEQRAQAAGALRLRQYGDRWVTADELEQLQQQEAAAARARKVWVQQVAEWRRTVRGSDRKRREKALAELRQLDDAAAIPLLERQLSSISPEVATAVVSVLANIPDEIATQSLVRHAVQLPWDEVVHVACAELKNKPKHEYVPMLLDALEQPLASQFSIRMTGMGLVHEHMIVQETESANFATVGRVLDARQDASVSIDQVARAQQRARQIQRQVQGNNQRVERQNQRVFRVLEQTTGEILRQDASAWWDWWNEYNDVYRSDEPKTTYVSAQQFSIGSPSFLAQSHPECFRAGTLVWTEHGMVAIDRIRPGDRVVAQDVVTGELGLRAVIEQTVRPDSSMMEVTVDGCTIVSTKGHPFWVNEQGWTMARELESGMRVHTLRGAIQVDSAARLVDKEPAYNLIVDRFGTYFVSEKAVLVHDGTDRKVPRVALPGLALADERSSIFEARQRE